MFWFLARWMTCAAVVMAIIPRAAFAGEDARPPAAPIISLSAEAGYGGYTKTYAWTPVRVSVGNVGDPVEAVIQLASSDANNPVKTRASVSLPRGARRVLTLYAAPGINAITVQALDATNAPLAAATPTVRPLGTGDHLTLVISDPADAYAFLADRPAPAKRGYVAQLRAEQTPDLLAALDGLDQIVIGNADSGAFSAAQRAAIRAWVLGGGQLVIAGGPGAALSGRGFADVLPAQAQPALLNIQNPAQVMADFARPNSLVLTNTRAVAAPAPTSAPSAQLRVTAPDAQVLLSGAAGNGDYPLIVRRALGRGVIDQLAFDPTLGGWADTAPARAARTDLFEMLRGGRVDAALAAPTLIKNTARAMPVSALPSVLIIAAFLSVFVLAIGPGNYLLLKRLNRLAWAWASVPALALAFALAAALLGAGARGSAPSLNRLTVWMGDARVADGRAHVIAGVFAPRRADLPITLGDTLAVELPPDQQNDPLAPVLVEVAQPNRIAPFAIDSSAARSLYARGAAALPAASPIGSALVFTPALGGGQARLGGEIRNASAAPLTDCALIVGRDYAVVGNLAPGAAAFAELTLWQDESQSHLLAQEAYSPYGNTFSSFRSMFNSAPRSSQTATGSILRRNAFFDFGGPAVTAPFIEWRAAANRNADQAQQELVVALFGAGSRAGDGANLACWSAINPTGITAQDTPAQTYDHALLVWRLPAQNVLLGAGASLPPGAFEWRVANGEADLTDTINLQMDAALNTMADQLDAASLQIYDWRARSFVSAAPTLSITNRLSLTGAYASPSGEVRLRLNTGADGLAINQLRVSVTSGQ